MNAFLQWLEANQSRIQVVVVGKTKVKPNWSYHRRILQDEFLIYSIIENATSAFLAEREIVLKQGDFIWINPGVEHTLSNAVANQSVFKYHLRFRVESPVQKTPFPEPFRLFQASATTNHLFETIHDQFPQPDPIWSPLCQRVIFAICYSILEIGIHRKGLRRTLRSSQCQRLESYLRNRISDPPNPSDLAEVVGLSHDYFSRVFKNTYDTTPKSWILQKRLQKAAEYLYHSNLTISEISEALGFCDLYSFSAQFKKFFGESPSSHRRRMG